MSKRKYLVLMKSQPKDASQPRSGPSPEQMQQMFAAYKAWMETYQAHIVDLGDKLLPGGRVLTMSASGLADGPFVEAKEVVGGFMIISAKDEAEAVAVVKACPAVQMPGAVLEIREMSGAKM